jgi:hypothetical protein
MNEGPPRQCDILPDSRVIHINWYIVCHFEDFVSFKDTFRVESGERRECLAVTLRFST